MRKHFYILFLTFCIIVFDITIFCVCDNQGQFENKTVMFSSIVMMILALFFPISFYTCFQLITDDNKKGHILATLMESMDGFIAGLIIIPFLLSPIFIYDYILYFINDLKKSRNK